MTAGVAAARRGGPVVQAHYAARRDRRVDRDRAVKLARQLGATYSTDTIIDGTPHFVVWKDGKPVRRSRTLPTWRRGRSSRASTRTSR